ncbi:MAG: HEPN domain-containing protein [Phototrophicaceae bacterium]|jgi:hypothetical protein
MKLTDEIINYEDRLSRLFGQIEKFDIANPLYPEMLRYILIRITGYLEVSLDSLLLAYTDHELSSIPSARTRKVVEVYVQGFSSAKFDKIRDMLEAFDEDWEKEFRAKAKTAFPKAPISVADKLNGLFVLRNQLAHGGDSPIGITELQDYFDFAKKIIRIVAEILPDSAP